MACLMRDRFTRGAIWEVDIAHGTFEWTVIDRPLHKDQCQDCDEGDGDLVVSDDGLRFLFFGCVLTTKTASHMGGIEEQLTVVQ